MTKMQIRVSSTLHWQRKLVVTTSK